MRLVFQALGKQTAAGFVPAAHGKVTVRALDDAGAVTDLFEVRPGSPRSRARAAAHGCPDIDVIRCCDEAVRTGQPVEWSPPDPAAIPAGHVTATVREFEKTEGESHTAPALTLLRDVLPAVPTDRLFTWTGREDLCCLDVDYHVTAPPPKPWLEAVVETRLSPRPVAWHFSRGGGLHLFYVATPRFSAEELAAAAALRFRLTEPAAGLDLVTAVRGPGAEKLRLYSAQDTQGTLAGWLKGAMEADPEDVEAYLETQGWTRGQRLDHTHCPINPTPGHPSTGNPVTVGEAGVHCHRCAGQGLSLGCRKPGFAPYSALTGTPGSSDVGRMVRERTHWGHAKWVLTEKYGLPLALARLAYSAAIKAAHPEIAEDEMAAVFCRETECMSRSFRNTWVNLESGGYIYPTNSSLPLIAALPACLTRTEKGALVSSPRIVSHMSQGHDLSDRGYNPIRDIQGFSMSRPWLPPSSNTLAVVLLKELRGSSRAPKYLLPSQRRPVEWAEKVFERWFPGICWPLIRSQLCASGVAQETQRGSWLPATFIEGGSGTAKSTHMKLVAGILGTKAMEVVYEKDETRLKMGFSAAADSGAFAVCNEYLKEYHRATGKYDPVAAMNAILNLTPDVLVHVLHIGKRPLGRVPAIVFTEPKMPYMLANLQQIARRVRTIRLYGYKSWVEPLNALGLAGDTINTFRLKDAELAEASDVILSDTVDRYFSTEMTFDNMADDLGVPTIMNSPHRDDPMPYLREFYRLVCRAPELDDPRLMTQYGKGYKKIHRMAQRQGDEALIDVWTMFADGPDKAWTRSEKLSERSWGDDLGIGGAHVDLDIKTDGASSVFVRFRVGPVKTPLQLNGEIAPALVTETSHVEGVS